jgi:hypothetical protein
MTDERGLVDSRRIASLAGKFPDKQYREGYVAAHTRGVLARQMRNFRGELSQAEYAAKIGKQKTVVGRLESPAYGGWSVRTMLDIARKENVAVIARFVDFPTFLSFTDDMSDYALHPLPYDEAEVDRFAAYQTGQVSYHDISIPSDLNIATSMGPPNPSMRPAAYQDIFFFSSHSTSQTDAIGAAREGLLPTGTGLGTVGPSGFPLPFQGINYFGGSGTVWPTFYSTASQLFTPTPAFMPPPTPSALQRAHAEIRRLDNLVQMQDALIVTQRQRIDQLQRQVNATSAQQGLEAMVTNLGRVENPIQRQIISFREAA